MTARGSASNRRYIKVYLVHEDDVHECVITRSMRSRAIVHEHYAAMLDATMLLVVNIDCIGETRNVEKSVDVRQNDKCASLALE